MALAAQPHGTYAPCPLGHTAQAGVVGGGGGEGGDGIGDGQPGQGLQAAPTGAVLHAPFLLQAHHRGGGVNGCAAVWVGKGERDADI